MDAESLLPFVRYHAWANDRILTTIAELSDEELRRPDVLDLGSAFDTLRHLVDVDWSWREALIGNDVGETYVWDHGFVLDDVSAIHAFSIEEDLRLRGYVGSLDEPTLNAPLMMGENWARPPWIVVAHIVSHGTQHRSELARYCTECGHSPGDLDNMLDALELPWPGEAAKPG
jgi:uncharacterized damage-inducible protein DinB